MSKICLRYPSCETARRFTSTVNCPAAESCPGYVAPQPEHSVSSASTLFQKEYSRTFYKRYTGDASVDSQLNTFLVEHPEYEVKSFCFSSSNDGTCKESLLVLFARVEDAVPEVE